MSKMCRVSANCALLMLVWMSLGASAAAQAREGNSDPSPAAGAASPTWRWPHQGIARLNQTTEGWLSVGGEVRLRWEGRHNAGFRAENDDGSLLTRVRLNLDVHPGSWFRAFIEGQDSQVIGLAASPDTPVFQDRFDLRQAYVDFFHRQRKGLGLRVGRQELIFGEERLIGAFNFSNTARTFDAARVYYQNKVVRLDVFGAAVVRIEDERFNRRMKGDNLYGIHATFPNAVPNLRWDVYTLWRAQSRLVNEQRRSGDADRVTFGTRVVGTTRRNFDYGMEAVAQVGDVAGDDVRAGALHVLLGYTLANVRAKPRIVAEYNFASGDDDPTDGKIGTFDQLFPANHAKYGYADLVGWRNIHDVHFGLSLKPVQPLSINFDTRSFWLASRRDAFYNAAGQPVARIVEGARSRHVGQEVDVSGSVKLSGHLFLEAAYAYLFAGDFLKQATPGKNTSYTYGMFTYRF
jgi:hypothetical protein